MIRITISSQAGLTALALLATLTGGCKQTPLCSELGSCGGPAPYGTWRLDANHTTCIEDLYEPPEDPRLRGGEVPVARQPIIEPAFFDWCYGLVTSGGTDIRARPPQFFYESGPIGWANMQYKQDGTYALGISRTGTYYLDFPSYCMRAFGAQDDRPALNNQLMPEGPPTNVCKQLQPRLAESGIGEGSYRNIICDISPQDPGGCLCQFDVAETGGSSGAWRILDDHTIMHQPYQNFPERATFCNNGTSLELTGQDGEYLFGKTGLRTMKLVNVPLDPCQNAVQDGDETGVDCGGSCPNACM